MAQRTSKQGVRITRELLAKALTWHCPFYTRDGVASRCDDGDGHPTNCGGAAMLCTRITDVFRTMVKIQNGEIEVY